MLRVLVLACLSTGCIVPFAAPGSRVEGGYLMGSSGGRGTVRAGAHVVGNRLDEGSRWDVGVGYVAVAGADAATAERRMDSPALTASQQGGYLEGSYLHRLSPNTRASIGPGVEVLVRGEDRAVAPVLYARAALEMFTKVDEAGSGSDRCGAAIGAWRGQLGIGTYVDVQRPLVDGGISVVAGLSLRIPSIVGVAMVIPGCK